MSSKIIYIFMNIFTNCLLMHIFCCLALCLNVKFTGEGISISFHCCIIFHCVVIGCLFISSTDGHFGSIILPSYIQLPYWACSWPPEFSEGNFFFYGVRNALDSTWDAKMYKKMWLSNGSSHSGDRDTDTSTTTDSRIC